jgi:hypothetical protein
MVKNNSGGGCLVILTIIGIIVYFPMKCYHNLTFDPLEYTIVTKQANLRYGPGKAFTVIRTLLKGDAVYQISDSSIAKKPVYLKEKDTTILVSDPQWIRVVNNKDTGWIHKSTLSQDKWD